MKIASIRDEDCIGCNRCVDACPVYAIIGAKNYLHGVKQDDCIGCDLCVPACPVDCIEISPIQVTLIEKQQLAKRAKVNYLKNLERKNKKQKFLLPSTESKIKIKDDLNNMLNMNNPSKDFKVYGDKI